MVNVCCVTVDSLPSMANASSLCFHAWIIRPVGSVPNVSSIMSLGPISNARHEVRIAIYGRNSVPTTQHLADWFRFRSEESARSH